MTTATVGARYQVVIPRRERDKMRLKPHTKVCVESRGDCLVIYRLDASEVRGIGRDLHDGSDTSDYVKQLRTEWADRTI